MADDDRRSLLSARRQWNKLPRGRRSKLWRGPDRPRDVQEREAAIGYARYLRSGLALGEWALAGLGGAIVLVVLGTLTWVGAALWLVAWTIGGGFVRRAQAARMERRARADPDAQA
jgi:hypothetical protein